MPPHPRDFSKDEKKAKKNVEEIKRLQEALKKDQYAIIINGELDVFTSCAIKGIVPALGTKGYFVVWIQQRLNDFGYEVPITGKYNHETRKKVIAFQKKRRMNLIKKEPGRVTYDTVLKLLFKERKPPNQNSS